VDNYFKLRNENTNYIILKTYKLKNVEKTTKFKNLRKVTTISLST